MSKPKIPNYNALETRKPRITKYGYCHWCFEPRHKNSPDTNPETFGWCSFRCAYDEISSTLDGEYDMTGDPMCYMCGVNNNDDSGENCHPDCTVWGNEEDDE
tara:strand:- start:222 stop:527 length:306 start_codon:yes stop_codon:yes gene_type:complete